MTDLALQVRLSAIDGGLVGQLRLTRQEVEQLTAAQAPAAAAAAQSATAADRSAAANSKVGQTAEGAAAGSRSLAAAQTDLMRATGGASAGADDLAASTAKASVAEKQLEGDIARLRAAVDPAGEAQRRLARDIDLANTALEQGKIDMAQYGVAIDQANARSRGELATIGQKRVGYQQLGYQIGDVSQQLALGVNPAIVFGQQIGQVTQAVQLMSGKTTGFIGFLAGPWGAALTGAITVAALLGSTLFQSADAMEAAKVGSNGLAEAQSVLGDIFDLTTGKLKSQNEALILNARLTAINLRSQALKEQESSRETFDSAGQVGFISGLRSTTVGRAIRAGLGQTGPTQAELNAMNVGGIVDQVRAGRLTPEAALRQSETTDFTNLAIDKAQFQQAIIDAASSEAKTKIANLIDSSLDSGQLAGGLRRPERGRQGPSAETLDRRRQQLAEFGADATDRIANLVGGFADAPPQVERVRKALAQLDDLVDDIGRKKPLNMEQLLADAAAARPLIENGINKPLDDYLRAQAEQLEIQSLVAEGRTVEADALRAILRIEEARGPLTKEQRAEIVASVQAIEDQERATERLRQRQASQLNVLDQQRSIIRDSLVDVRNLADAPDRLLQAFEGFAADQLFEKMFGDAFQELEDQVTGAGKVEEASDRIAGAVDRVTRSLARLGDAAEGAATGVGTTAQQDQADQDIVVTGRRDPRAFFERSLTKLGETILGPETAEAFGKNATKALGGAATGSIVAGVGDLLGIKTSSTGARLGGAAGAFLPIPGGDIVGSIVGGLVGNLFGPKAKGGSATIGSLDGDAALSGNSRALKDAAGTMASGVQSSLQRIVDALGGEAGNFGVSIGTRSGARADKYGAFLVDPTGQGRTTGSGLQVYKTEAEAMAAAVTLAIQQGAVSGLSAAVSSALRSSKDVEAAVAEALKVDQIETLIGGPEAALQKGFKAFERDAAERERVARKYGLDLVKLEEATGRERVALFEGLLADATGSLSGFLDDLRIGDLFEGSLAEQRDALRAELAKAEADVKAGVAGAADRQAEVSRRLLDVSREAFGTAGGEFAADRSEAQAAADRTIAQETERLKAAQDAARATNEKLDRANLLADERNTLAAQQLAALRQMTAALGSGSGGGVFFAEPREVALR